MKVRDIRKVEDCFDGSRVFEFQLDEAIDEAFIQKIGGLGKLEYFQDFARPFFRVTCPGASQIKGVQGNSTFQVVIFANLVESLEHIRARINDTPQEGVHHGETP